MRTELQRKWRCVSCHDSYITCPLKSPYSVISGLSNSFYCCSFMLLTVKHLHVLTMKINCAALIFLSSLFWADKSKFHRERDNLFRYWWKPSFSPLNHMLEFFLFINSTNQPQQPLKCQVKNNTIILLGNKSTHNCLARLSYTTHPLHFFPIFLHYMLEFKRIFIWNSFGGPTQNSPSWWSKMK